MHSEKTKRLEALASRADETDKMIASLRLQLLEVRKAIVDKRMIELCNHLRCENEQLKTDIETLKSNLIEIETRKGIKQISVPASLKQQQVVVNGELPEAKKTSATVTTSNRLEKEKSPAKVAGKSSKETKSPKTATGQQKPDEKVDVSRLDLKIGRILSVKKHPDADTLYIEDVDVGNDDRRTVVSGLVRFYTLEEMNNKIAVFLCNLKPAKMRGVTSEAMIMCACTADKTEVLVPPQGSVPGDRVICDGYDGKPDAEINPKKPVFEKIAADLKTDTDRKATYKGVPWSVPGKGLVLAPSLTSAQIR